MNNTYIIAEVGVNGNGDFDTAMTLTEVAINAGVDAVKYQLWRKNRFPDIEHLRLLKEEITCLITRCKDKGVDGFATAFDFQSIDFLESIGQNIWKIPSGLSENKLYMQKISQTDFQRVFISTGLSKFDDVYELICDTFTKILDWSKIFMMHCVSKYPTEYKDVGLNELKDIILFHGSYFIGLSDHTPGIETSIAAVALGAKVIEKHITLDRYQDGPDHSSSIEPHELKQMVGMIRNVELAMGDSFEKDIPNRDKIIETMWKGL